MCCGSEIDFIDIGFQDIDLVPSSSEIAKPIVAIFACDLEDRELTACTPTCSCDPTTTKKTCLEVYIGSDNVPEHVSSHIAKVIDTDLAYENSRSGRQQARAGALLVAEARLQQSAYGDDQHV